MLPDVTETTGDLPPLAGLRVIDFGHYLAGPLAGMLLADQGAEVIKVARPGQPDCATPAGAVFNRGKQTVELDLKSAAGRGAALQLVRSADVLIDCRLALDTSITTGRANLACKEFELVDMCT